MLSHLEDTLEEVRTLEHIIRAEREGRKKAEAVCVSIARAIEYANLLS